MTCVVGAISEDDNTIVIASDAFGGNHYSKGIYDSPKSFVIPIKTGPPMLVGFTTSWRFGQLVQYGLPKHDFANWNEYGTGEGFLVNEVIPVIRTLLSEGGFMVEENGRESGGQLLIAHDFDLYYIEHDFSVIRCADKVAAIGSGATVALGALSALHMRGDDLVDIAAESILMAAKHNPYVSPPVTVLSIKRKKNNKYKKDVYTIE